MSADDFQPFPPDAAVPDPSDPAAGYPAGNRPASGARRATPGEVLSRGFHGAQNAGDFLGLDVEFTSHQDPSAHPGVLDLEAAPTTYVDPASAYPADAGATGSETFPRNPSAYDYGQDLGADEVEPEPAPAPARRALPLFAATALVGVLGAVGLFYGPDLYRRFVSPQPERVASGPRPARTPARDPGAVAEKTPVDVTLVAPAPIEPDTPEDPDPLASASTLAEPPPLQDPELLGLDGGPVPFDESSSAIATDPAEPQPSAGDLVASLLGAATGASEPASDFPDLAGADYEWISEDQLELIWRGTSVPMEAVFAPARTIMPRVGNVRIFTLTGDVFEGRLYAVGQDRVWIDAAPGRIGLDGTKVERIELLPLEPAGTQVGEVNPSGRRVRVRVPGGMLYGRVLKVEGDEAILALDDGGKVRVLGASVEDLGSGRAVIVHR